MTIRKGFLFQCAGAACLVFACIRCSDRQSRSTSSALPPTTAPAPAMLCVVPTSGSAISPGAPTPPHTFDGAGVQFDYPGDWVFTKSATSIFCIVAPGNGVNAIDRPVLCLDVPKLPWHIPGMISCGMVASGYLDDLRKNHIPDAALKDERLIKVGGENAKQLTCIGHENGKPVADVAIVLVHADRVYIFSTDCDCAAAHRVAAGKALAMSTGSIKWTR